MSYCLPPFVGLYRRRDNDFISKIVSKNAKLYTIEERKLRRFFKCTQYFEIKNKCFATKNYKKSFLEHLHKCHSKQKLFCVYCFPFISHTNQDKVVKTMYSNEALINHMIETHRFRRYQCNLCLFRAISAEHINIHQSIIHSSLHNSSRINQGSGAKLCKIIECPPIDGTNESTVMPKLYDYYNRYHETRKNIDGIHDNYFQCLYCDFMNESKSEVIDHCAQKHADFPIMFYKPEPEITSTQSPKTNGQSPVRVTQFDLFSGREETQENRVSSTGLHEPIDLDSDDSENANSADSHLNDCKKRTNDDNHYENGFNKKQRTSHIQSRNLTNIQLAAQKLKMKAMSSADKSSLISLKQRDDRKWRPNSLMRNNGSPRSRPSLNVSPPLENSVERVKDEKKLICLLCEGNTREMKESTISSHLHMYHNTCKIKAPNLPFCCDHCKQFCGSEVEVKCHSRNCQNRRSDESHKIFVFIIPKEEYESKTQFNDRNEDKFENNDSKKEKKSIISNKSSIIEETISKSLESNDETNDDLGKHDFDSKKKDKTYLVKERQTSANCNSDELNVCKQFKNSNQLKTTTIEMAEPEETEDIVKHLKPEYVCLFCDNSFIDSKSAITHLETHFPDISKAMDDYEVTKPVHKWIKNFVFKQFSLFEEMNASNEDICFEGSDDLNNSYRYQCPICVKFEKLKNLRAKRFKNFWELKVHYWEHSCWLPVKCKICRPDYDLPNCDHLIVRHLNSKHHEKLVTSHNEFVKTIIGDKMKNSFSVEQRLALEQSFITYYRFEILDSHIENTLKMICAEQELKLRLINGCSEELPQIKLSKLPKIDFDDQNVVKKFLKQFNKNNSSGNSSKTLSIDETHEEIQLGSSSDESEHRIPVIIRKKPKFLKRLFDEKCSHDFNGKCADTQSLINDNCNSDVLIINNNNNNKDGKGLTSKQSIRTSDSHNCTQNSKVSQCSDSEAKISSNNISSIERMDTSNGTKENKVVNSVESETIDINEGNTSSIVSPDAIPQVMAISINEKSSPNTRLVCVCGHCSQHFPNTKAIKDHIKKEHPNQAIQFNRKSI